MEGYEYLRNPSVAELSFASLARGRTVMRLETVVGLPDPQRPTTELQIGARVLRGTVTENGGLTVVAGQHGFALPTVDGLDEIHRQHPINRLTEQWSPASVERHLNAKGLMIRQPLIFSVEQLNNYPLAVKPHKVADHMRLPGRHCHTVAGEDVDALLQAFEDSDHLEGQFIASTGRLLAGGQIALQIA